MKNFTSRDPQARKRMLLAATSAALGAFALIASCGGDDNGNPGAAGGTGGSGGSYAGSGGMGGAAQGGAAGQGGSSGQAGNRAGNGGQSGTGGGGGTAGSGQAGGDGGQPDGGTVIAGGPSRGSPIALTPKDEYALVVNRDVGSVSVVSLSYAAPDAPAATKVAEVSTGAGSEPWQLETSPDGKSAYVVLRRDQKLVRVDDIGATAK